MRVPDGVRRSVNVLLCLAAVVAIGWSGREIGRVWDARRQIDEACAGLVPAGRVLALSPAGGRITHRQAEEGVIDLGAGTAQDCEIFSTEAGEKNGEDRGGRWFFTGAVGVLPADRPTVADGPLEDLVDSGGGPTHPDQPLGGGIAGRVTESDVVVQLPCAGGRLNGRPVKALWARASLQSPAPRFTDGGQLGAHDRAVLAETAVLTANNLAGRVGCADRLPDPPADVPALPEGPVPAARAEGTCAWYREGGFARRPELPDQVVESRTDDRLWDERCGLVLGESRAGALYLAEADDHEYLIRPDSPGQWFVSLHTYAGEDAKNVLLTSTDLREDPEPATPGRAGRSSEDPIWWASSVCDGEPQIHTMSLALSYHRLVTPRMEQVFRAYVEDVTARRHCTDLVFPEKPAFRAD
ncbi:hypothetical protein SAM23877_3596 [Streptomyces ambofaciens ATCC 23877]|uniref:Uncharacterized protein n=1 Tax=Streptomyces ambofaciens (strain ATCC 23877 / 3486 / DSM 40053 / JCM 4204 / NBRC 12836 / NRRL B-2516) TaxID=278992 RepID=A0A0K2AUI2_STRA7|nr:hypothetical protein [Streptomyces ambofaciens]AKZ56643.1 hypothetical protein SAM23877_3596 [Streptomyces ambofaciens ATCC 23877]